MSGTDFMLQGACRDLDVMFPTDGVGVDRAKRICAGCPVTAECLEYALDQGVEHGVWGGTSERQRRRLRAQRRSSGQGLT